jgi:hypothetical protein
MFSPTKAALLQAVKKVTSQLGQVSQKMKLKNI